MLTTQQQVVLPFKRDSLEIPIFISILDKLTNAEGATIKFVDDTNATQFGLFTYKHSDGSSNSAGNSFHFNSSESSTAVIIDQTSGNSGFYVGTNKVWHG